MNHDTIIKALQERLTSENPIVFWDDADGEFLEQIGEIETALASKGISLVKRCDYAALELKAKFDYEPRSDGLFVLYAPEPAPNTEDDWLLNIRLYSKPSFSADQIAMHMNALGLTTPSLRYHLRERKKFLNSQKRCDALKKLIRSDDDADTIDMAMIALCVGASRPHLHEILLRLFIELHAYPDGDGPKWNEVCKYGLEEPFWRTVSKEFIYSGKASTLKEETLDATQNNTEKTVHVPTLEHFLTCLFVTDLAFALGEDLPQALQHFCIDDNQAQGTVASFFADWRHGQWGGRDYVDISTRQAELLNIESHIQYVPAQKLEVCSTFEAVENVIIRDILQNIADKSESSETLKNVILLRCERYWVRRFRENGVAIYNIIYDGISALLHMLDLRKLYGNGFSFENATGAWMAYTNGIFLFDQYYRHFCHAANQVETYRDIFKNIRSHVEKWYSEWYFPEIARAWDEVLGGDTGLMKTWRLSDIPSQFNFYPHFVQPALKQKGNPRVFVIISDGLRFEVAHELSKKMTSEARLSAELHSQISVLPSITSMGMAALLPHTKLSFKQGTTDVLADGLPTGSLEQRDEILKRKDGRAIKAQTLIKMSGEDARKFLDDAKVLYIYHDQIDSMGDSGATETATFSAVHDTLIFMRKVVDFIVKSMNGSNIFITADHGFLYQDDLNETTRNASHQKVEGTLKAKKRYALGYDLVASSTVWHGSTGKTANMVHDANAQDMEFCIPKGVGRFHFQGGARYVHGGAMPQECVVPVLEIHKPRGKQRGSVHDTKVGVTFKSPTSNCIVKTEQNFTFYQHDKVTDYMAPRTLEIFISDDVEVVSDVQYLIFKSSSEKTEDLTRNVKLTLKGKDFKRGKEYFLIARDADTDIEYLRYAMRIDLSFANLF